MVVVFIYIKSIGTCHQVPVEPPEQRDFIGKQSIEVVLQVSQCIKRSRGAACVITYQLEAVDILTGCCGKVTVEVLEVLYVHTLIIEETSNAYAVFEQSANFKIEVIVDAELPFVKVYIAA